LQTIKKAYLVDDAIPNRHNHNSTITEKLHKYTDLKQKPITATEHGLYSTLVLPTTGTIPKKHKTLSYSVFVLVCILVS